MAILWDDPMPLIRWFWLALMVVWLAAAVAWGGRPVLRTQTMSTRLFHWGFMLLAAAFGFGDWVRSGWLLWRWLPPSAASAWTGAGLTAVGIAIAIWARLIVGGNWSAIASIRSGQRLIRSGPYRLVRHPIYSGLLLALLGSAVTQGQLRSLIAVAAITLSMMQKAAIEEQLLQGEFGEEYVNYRRHSRALIPGIF